MDLLDDDGLLDIRRRARRTDPEGVTQELRERREDLPDANPALSRWAADLGRSPDDAPRAHDDAPTDACHVCQKTARYTCTQCDRRACAADYWVMFGLCRACAKEERVQRWHQGPQTEGHNWLDPK